VAVNALGFLTRARRSYSYAKTYASKVFFMDRFIDVLFGKRPEEERKSQDERISDI